MIKKQCPEWIHTILLTTIIVPLVYAVLVRDQYPMTIYIKSLLIVFPVVLSGIMAEKCRGLFTYVLGSVCLLACYFYLAYLLGAGEGDQKLWIYTVILWVEGLFFFIFRFLSRVQKNRQIKAQKEDPFYVPEYSFTIEPDVRYLFVFATVYLLGICYSFETLCDVTFINGVLYLFMILHTEFCTRANAYMELNHQVKNVPAKRILRIGNGLTKVLGSVFVLFLCVALGLRTKRPYGDLSAILKKRAVPPEMFMEEMTEASAPYTDPMEELIEAMGPAKQLPVWVDTLLQVIACVIFLLCLYGIGKLVVRALLDFKSENTENGDLIESLEEDREGIFSRMRKQKDPIDKEAHKVRRAYKKTIRKHRKDTPDKSESPSEIEALAGLSNTEEMKALHAVYEQVRYGERQL